VVARDRIAPELALPPLDIGTLARRVAVPAVVAAGAAALLVAAGGRFHPLAGLLRRVLDANPGWAATGIVFECVSLAGYVALMWLVARRATPRVGARESAQITFAGAAATRLLPTAGAGGVALTVWALRRAGLGSRAAARTLLSFLALLYSVFLGAVVVSGATLAASGRGSAPLSAIPAAAALLVIGACAALAIRRPLHGRSRAVRAARLTGAAVRDAAGLVRSRDPRLAGAFAYWAFDAAVVWAMLDAVGASPALPVVGFAYLVGQVANTAPLPGSVSGGMAGVLIAFGVPAEAALPSVLAYRTIAVWLPLPLAVAALPRLRATVARWAREPVAVGAQTGPA
jgi:uncharacterized membrane protein YbhN (UPF0104 family)